MVGAPPNDPNYACIPWSTSANWIGINLVLSNSTALMAFSDSNCQTLLSWIECPSEKDVDCDQGQFCAKQSDNGGANNVAWQSVMYRIP